MDKRGKQLKPTRKGKSKKRAKDEEGMDKEGKGVPLPHAGPFLLDIVTLALPATRNAAHDYTVFCL